MAVSQQGGREKRKSGEPPQHSSVASGPAAIVGPSPVPGRVFPSDPEESRPVLRSLVKVFRFPVICCSPFCLRRVRDQTGEPGCIRAALTVDFLKSRRSGLLPAPGNELLCLATAQLALRRRKAGVSRTFSSIELRTREERPYGSSPCGAAWRACSEIGFAGRASAWRGARPRRGGALFRRGGPPPRPAGVSRRL